MCVGLAHRMVLILILTKFIPNIFCKLRLIPKKDINKQILLSSKICYLWPFFTKNPQVEANVCWPHPSYGAHTYSCEIHPAHFLQIVIDI